MLDAVNDEEQHAHQLGKLLETLQLVTFKVLSCNICQFLEVSSTTLMPFSDFAQVVNLIPFNPIGSLSCYSTSDDQKVIKFQKILRGTYNIRTTIRKQMGQDISGACGQLVIKKPDILTDIEDLHI